MFATQTDRCMAPRASTGTARKIFCAGLILAASAFSDSALAVDRYVDSLAGVDAVGCADPLAPCQTIAHTINQSSAGDSIHLISLAGAPATFFESGLTIPFDLTIQGEGPFRTVIDAQGADRAFSVNGNLTVFDGVTLINGDAGFSNGGAIALLSGDLVVSRARLLDNTALAGGAIAASAGAGYVTVVGSVVKGNLATGSGGGIWCDGCTAVLVTLSRMVENITGGLGGEINGFGTTVTTWASHLSRNNADGGGAIYANFADVHVLDSELASNEADATDGGAVNVGGTLNIQRSTLAENTAAEEGGAVYIAGVGPFVSANSTYSGNEAWVGGALALFANIGPGADVLIGTSTFFDNESTFPGVAEHIFGGWNTFGLYNSIVANDLSGGAVFDPYCSGPVTAGQHNLIDDASCDTGAGTFNFGIVTGLDQGLAYNGGLTRTHAVGSASNAVDAGHNASCLNPATGTALVIDQRAQPRPVDYDGNGVAECDIGAVELH